MAKICDNCKATGGFFKDDTFINFKGMNLCSSCASKLIEKNIKETRDIVKKRLKSLAYEKEGNAIIKFRFGYEGISANRMIMMASGTVVRISKREEIQ